MGKMRLIKDAFGTTEGFCLVKSAAVRTDVKGTEYLDMVLADSEGECVAKLWNYSRITHGSYDVNDIVKVRGTVQVWMGIPRYGFRRQNAQFRISIGYNPYRRI